MTYLPSLDLIFTNNERIQSAFEMFEDQEDSDFGETIGKEIYFKHATLISEDDNSSHAVQTVVKGATLNIFITPIDPIVLCHMQGDEST